MTKKCSNKTAYTRSRLGKSRFIGQEYAQPSRRAPQWLHSTSLRLDVWKISIHSRAVGLFHWFGSSGGCCIEPGFKGVATKASYGVQSRWHDECLSGSPFKDNRRSPHSYHRTLPEMDQRGLCEFIGSSFDCRERCRPLFRQETLLLSHVGRDNYSNAYPLQCFRCPLQIRNQYASPRE